MRLAILTILRIIGYEENDDGFMFSRAKTKKQKPSKVAPDPAPEEPQPSKSKSSRKSLRRSTRGSDAPLEQTERENGNSAPQEPSPRPSRVRELSVANTTSPGKVRRSKRLSEELDHRTRDKESVSRTTGTQVIPAEKERQAEKQQSPKQPQEQDAPEAVPRSMREGTLEVATKIALPFADTPVQRRNKEMRQGKGGKSSERRSSVGLRGRRASSLIDTGASNGEFALSMHDLLWLSCANACVIQALPHDAVDSSDFYKHIESSLPEPRRMRQLLTWCATRTIGEKPQNFKSDEERGVRLAGMCSAKASSDFTFTDVMQPERYKRNC